MSTFFAGVGVIFSLEMRQRVRGVAWYVLLGVFVALVALVTFGLTVALTGFGNDPGGGIFSAIIYFVLLLGTLVAPALSGNAINGDRDAGTLATTQITLISTWQLILGKFLAAWLIALAFLAAALPFLLYSALTGGMDSLTIIVSTLVLAFELGVVAAVGVGLSGILSRPLFSIVVTYLVVAALSVGTLIAFTIGGLATQTEVTVTSYPAARYTENGVPLDCFAESYTTRVPRFDHFWGVLVANPYVLLADAVPTEYDSNGYPEDMFGSIKFGVRSVQLSPIETIGYNECEDYDSYGSPNMRETIESTVPGWSVGMIIHLVLAGGALTGAWARTRTPAGRLTKGSRIA